MRLSIAVAALIGMMTMKQAGADAAGFETLTHLPFPNVASTLQVSNDPTPIADVPVCKSKGQMNFYTPSSGTVDAAITWYSATLKGFKHTHGYGSGRSQDTFYNAAGTLIVAITGSPAPQGENSNVYAIVYGTIQPGVSEKVMIGMNIQKVNCT